MRIAVVGLGKLGPPLAETLALRHEVSGFDLAKRTSETVRIAPSLADACAHAELVLVVLPTPHEAAYDGSAPATHLPPRDFAYAPVIEVLEAADEAAADGSTLAIVSTVLPGTTRRELAPHHEGVEFPAGSVVVDPWRRYASDVHQVVHYGSTRS